jgi:hypothetical protein
MNDELRRKVGEAIGYAWAAFLEERNPPLNNVKYLPHPVRRALAPEWHRWLEDRDIRTDCSDQNRVECWDPTNPPEGRSQPWPETLFLPMETALKVAFLGQVPKKD